MILPSAPHGLDVNALRASEFPHLGESIHLDAASFTPLPERSRAAVVALHERRARIHQLTDAELLGALRSGREAAARLVGAGVDEIALAWNTSFGINLAAQSLPLAPGSVVVVSDGEFPTNVYPWMAREGVALEIVPTRPDGNPDLERLMERLDRGDASAFALSSVQFATGHRAPLAELGRFCRERGIFFVVDAIQSLGQLPLDVEEACIDVLAAGAHKWLCAPFGTGFAYVRRELIPRMEPRFVGWTGMQSSADLGSLLDYRWAPRSDARRFEGGTLPAPDFAGFHRSLELLLEVGIEQVQLHVQRLLHPLAEWALAHPEVEVVSELAPQRRSGIFAFRPPRPEATIAALRAESIVCALREGAIRIAPHLYNTPEEMERVVETLEASRERGWS